MIHFNLSRSVVVGIAVLLMPLFLFTGCQQAPNRERFSSAKGVSVEFFLPADTFMFFKVGTSDMAQLKNLAELNAYFPNDPLKFIVDEFNKGFEEGASLQDYGLSYTEDILPMINEKSEFYFAVSPGDVEKGGTPDFVFAVTLADEEKLNSLLASQQLQGRLVQKDYYNRQYFMEVAEENSDVSAYFLRIEDVLFVTTNEEILHKGLDNVAVGENLLSKNPVYAKALADYSDSALVVYADFQKLVYFLQKSAELEVDENFLENFGLMGIQAEQVGEIESEVVLAKIEDEGIRVSVNLIAKDETGFKYLTTEMKPSYLVNSVPAVTPIIYFEGYNFRRSIDSFLALAKSDVEGVDPEFKDGIAQMKQFFEIQGLDLEEDILTFLDKGYAFVLQDTQSLIPGIGLYVDVSGNADGAVKVSRKINDSFTGLWGQALEESPEMAMFVQKFDVVPEKLWKFGLNINALLAGQSGALQKKLSGQVIEFYYGVLEDDVMTFALESNLEQSFGKGDVVALNSEFKKAMTYLNGADIGVTYIAPGAFLRYLDRIIQLAQEEGMPASDLAEYDKVKSYILPLKSIVAASSSTDSKIGVQMFVHIAP